MHIGYIDPGNGSYLFQLLIAAASGVLFFFSSLRDRVSLWIRGKEPDAAETSFDKPIPPEDKREPDRIK